MGLRKQSPGGTVVREPTTNGVALKRLNSRKWHGCRKYTVNIPGALVSTPENACK